MIVEYAFLGFYFLFELVLFLVTPAAQIRPTLLLYFLTYYLMWSFLHQLRIRKFTLGVVLEYILIGALLLVLLKFLYFPSI